MMRIFEGLRFRRIPSPIHRLDPRSKAMYVAVISVLSIMYSDPLTLLVLIAVQAPMVALGRIGRLWLNSLRGSVSLAAFIFAVNMITNYLYVGGFTFEGLTMAVAMTLRFVTLMSVFSIFFLTTTPEDLSLALEKLRIPYDICFAFTAAMRFVPDIALEVQSIMDAQKSRGLELERGKFVERIRKTLPILIPLFIRSFQRSLELAEAMESRAYGAIKRRTSLYELKMSKGDYALAALSTVFLTAMVILRLFKPS